MSAGALTALVVLVAAALARRAAAAGRAGEARLRLAPLVPSRPSLSPSRRSLIGRRAWTRIRALPRQRRAERALLAGLPGALEQVGRRLRTGLTLQQALAADRADADAPAEAALHAVAVRAERGLGVASAAAAWGTTVPAVEVRLTAAALALAAEAGGAQARAIEGVAATLRERAAARADVRAQSAQARLSALVIGLLPLAFTLWCVLTDARIASFLFATSAGWACLVGGLGLDALGGLWMRRLVREAMA